MSDESRWVLHYEVNRTLDEDLSRVQQVLPCSETEGTIDCGPDITRLTCDSFHRLRLLGSQIDYVTAPLTLWTLTLEPKRKGSE